MANLQIGERKNKFRKKEQLCNIPGMRREEVATLGIGLDPTNVFLMHLSITLKTIALEEKHHYYDEGDCYVISWASL